MESNSKLALIGRYTYWRKQAMTRMKKKKVNHHGEKYFINQSDLRRIDRL
jgi:hypothetical protein